MTKTILITGSTDGIGKLAAISLAKEGHELYLHGRNVEKLTMVIDEIKGLSENEKIDGFVADFKDMEAVKRMASQIKSKISKMDVLINNAGIFKSSSSMNQDGIDIRIAVNYLAPYLLTNELLPLLEKGDKARIINLSSAAQASISEDVLSGKQKVGEMQAYSQSKLAITMWSTYLAKKFSGLTIIPVNPGSLLDTNMVREAFGHSRSSADKGGNILVQLALSEEMDKFSGHYFDNDRGFFGRAHQDAYDENKIARMIQITNEALEM